MKQVQPRDWQQRFEGFRVNCESIPRLPAWVVGQMINFPLEDFESHHLTWHWMNQDEVKESLTLRFQQNGMVAALVRNGGTSIENLGLVRRHLPRFGGSFLLLVCPVCGRPRRHLYAWGLVEKRVHRTRWQCRSCAGLRYRSEGTYLCTWARCFGGYPRTPPWDPDEILQAN